MTERKPPGMEPATWVEQQIRQAERQGAFDDLPGAGKPIPKLADSHDEDWWIKGLLKRENIPTEELLPTPLKLRREIERLPETVSSLRTEAQVRDTVEEINLRVKDWIRFGTGPFVAVAPVDPDAVVAAWQEQREARKRELEARREAKAEAEAEQKARKKPWWRWKR